MSEKAQAAYEINSVNEDEKNQGINVGIEKHSGDDSSVAISGEDIADYYNRLSTECLEELHEKTGHGIDLEGTEIPKDIKFFLEKIIQSTDEEVLTHFQKVMDDFGDDTNFPTTDYQLIENVRSNPSLLEDPFEGFKAKLAHVLIKYHSPYPEVRAVTDYYDDVDEPIETIRSYTIGFFWLIVAAGIREFFSHRRPPIALSSMVCAVLMYPCGRAWEKIMPFWTVNFFGKKIPLNPGPYRFKEQVFATLIVSVASANVYVSYNIVTQVKFYDHDWVSFGYQLLLVLSTQFMGFSFAGLLRKFVIYPSRAVWPTILPSIALNRALLKSERKESIHGWTISKFKFFWTLLVCSALYYWIPNYLFTALSTFNWITWISPTNYNLGAIAGTQSGLGFINPIPTFDWNIVTGVYDPFAYPFMTMFNLATGAILGAFIIIGLHYSNHKWTGYLPINSNATFTNTGEIFNVSKVVKNGKLDNEMYQTYSPPFYSSANILVYSAFFFVYPFSFLFNTYKEWSTVKYAARVIKAGFKTEEKLSFKSLFMPGSEDNQKSMSHFDDPHSRMMAKYKEVPDIFFGVTLVISVVLAILLVKLYPDTETPVWGIFFVIGINVVFLIPFCLLYAVTGIAYGLNVLVELIVGYAINNGMAMMTLKALGYNIDGQAENYISSQKVAHYCKIPPRAFFRAQFLGTFVQGLVFLGVVNWSMSNIDGMCEPHQKQKFTCPSETTYYSASIFWGVIGPKIVFNGVYPLMKYAFLMGTLAGLAFIVQKHFAPKLIPKHLEPTVIITGMLNTYAPYNLGYVLPPLYVSFAFMHYIKRRFPAWFSKFTYVTSAALNSGVAFAAIIVFFSVQYKTVDISWWGNSVSNAGVDGGVGRTSYLDITKTVRGYFGPERGQYPTNESV